MSTFALLAALLLSAITALAGYLAGSARSNDRLAALVREAEG